MTDAMSSVGASDASSESGSPQPPRRASVGRDSLWVAAGTTLSRVTGFARVFVLAWAIGQSDLADVYALANTAPNLIYEFVVGGILSATLVPLFVRARERDDRDAASVLMSVGFVAAIALTLLAMGLTFGVDRWATARWEDLDGQVSSWTQFQSGMAMLYLFLPQILFYAITSLTTAYLNASRRYKTAAFAPVLTNVVSIIAFVIVGFRLQGRGDILDSTIFDSSTIYWLGIGTTAGIIAMTIPLLWEMRRLHNPLRFVPRFRHPIVSTLIRLSGWTFGYVAANQVALLFVATTVTSLSRYQNAFIFFQLPHGLIAVSLMTTITPELASAVAATDYQALADRFVRGLRLLASLLLPAAVGYALLAVPIASFLARGSLTAEDARLTGTTLAAFAIGLPAFSAYLYACRGFYAMSNTRTPFFLNLLENGANIAFVIVLSVSGRSSSAWFALAYSCSYAIAAVVALRRLERAVTAKDPAVIRPSLDPLIKMAAASVIMGLAVFATRLVLSADRGTGALVSVAVGVVIGVATYALAGLKLQIPEVTAAVANVRRRARV